MTRALAAMVLAGATACTSILGSFDVAPEGSGTDASDVQTTDVADSGGQDVQPDAPSNFLTGATQVAGGARHTCALVGTDVYCWGDNANGQLAQSGIPRSDRPVKVALPAPAKTLASGLFHTCVVSTSNDLYCWGKNDCGQVGGGNMNTPAVPTKVASMTGGLVWSVVAPGDTHTCAVEQGGATYCWGCNTQQQAGAIGAGPVTMASQAGAEKTAFASLSSSSAFTCGATTTAARCWGTETHGELGDNSAANANTMADIVSGITGVHAIVTGTAHTCIRDANDQIRCWGDDSVGQLGVTADGGGMQQLLPGAQIPGGPFQAVAANGSFTCFIASVGGQVSCVGANDQGQLGRGGSTDMSQHNAPQPVLSPDMASTPLVATAIGAGREHACAIIGGGGVVCWGNGSDGQLGDGNPGGGPRTTAVHVAKP